MEAAPAAAGEGATEGVGAPAWVGLLGVEQAPVAAHAALPVCARSFLLAAFSDLSPSTLKPICTQDDVAITFSQT